MTENEARTKWCPILIAVAPKASHTCLGSDCMMWRWNNPSPEVVDQARGVGFEPMLQSIGYCGLAGRPC